MLSSLLKKYKKDYKLSISNVEYCVRNVPFTELDAYGDEFFSIGVSVKLAAIIELMVENKIPHEVNFDDVADIQF